MFFSFMRVVVGLAGLSMCLWALSIMIFTGNIWPFLFWMGGFGALLSVAESISSS